MKFNKKHKLYFIDKHGAVCRLDKFDKYLYAYVINEFSTNGKKSEEWLELNQKGKEIGYKPINLSLPCDYHENFDKLKKVTNTNVSITLTYNSIWMPLVTIKK